MNISRTLRRTSREGAILLVSATLATGAHALNTVWSSIGGGCLPIAQTPANLAFNVWGGTKFVADKTGSITLFCPVTPPQKWARSMVVSYRDSDGTGSTAQVKAALRRKDRTSGEIVDVGGFVFDSNTSTGTTFRSGRSGGGCAGHAFDHEKYLYYVQVSLNQTSADRIAEFGGVALEADECIS